MRGRTNIPPRMGGIVNGDVSEYVVSAGYSIETGDYVEFVEGAGSSQYLALSTGITVPSDMFQLGDGTFGVFIPYSSAIADGLVLYRFSATKNGLSLIGSTPIDLSKVSPKVGNSSSSTTLTNEYYLRFLQMTPNTFLMCLPTYDSEQKRSILELKWDGSSFSISVLYTTAAYGYTTYKGVSSLNDDFFKWDDTHFIWFYPTASKTWTIAVMEYASGSVKMLTSLTGLAGPTDSSNFYRWRTFKTKDNTLLVLDWTVYYTTTVLSYKINISGKSITKGDTLYAPSAEYAGSAWVQLDETHFLVGKDSTSKNSKYLVTANIVTYTGSSLEVSPVYELTDYGRFSTSELFHENMTLLEDGRALWLEPYHSNGLRASASVLKYDEVSNSIGKVIPTDILLASYYPSGDIPYPGKVFFLEGGKKIMFSAYSIYTSGSTVSRGVTGVFMLSLEQNTILQFVSTPEVKPYTSRINGIAKSSGAEGSIVEVYVPSSLL